MKKNYFKALLLTACFGLMLSLNTSYAGTYGGGTGTDVDPFLISSIKDLLELDTTTLDWGKDYYFKLTTDLNMSGQTFYPIGYNADTILNPFKGEFDGDNHVISNLTVSPITGHGENAGFGLFGTAEATIKNLGLKNINIDVSLNRVGGIVGTLGKGSVSNCFVLGGTVKGAGWVGSIVGVIFNAGVKVTNCFSSASVPSGWGSGGIVGNIRAASPLKNVAFYGTVGGGQAPITNLQTAGNGPVTNAYRISTSGGNADTISTSLTSEEMKVQANFSGFDFDTLPVWKMHPNWYAVLASFPESVYNPDTTLADAGEDQLVIEGEMVTLDGSGSSSKTDTLKYSWSSPVEIDLDDSTAVKPKFTAPNVSGITSYMFVLVVNDKNSNSGPDTVYVKVRPKLTEPTDTLNKKTWTAIFASSEDVNPKNPNGGDLKEHAIDNDLSTKWFTDYNSGTDEFPLEIHIDMKRTAGISHFIYYSRQDPYGPNGTADGYRIYVSKDKENWGTASVTGVFAWPEYTGSNADDFKFGQLITLSSADTGRFIRFVVDSAVTEKKQATVAELYAFGEYFNSAPVADAGPDQTVKKAVEVTLDGSGSLDVDEDTITYAWTSIDPAITLSATDVPKPTFTSPEVTIATSYKFKLVVNDTKLDSEADTVMVTVDPDLTGVNNPNTVELSVYPNPSHGVFNLQVAKRVSVNVKDILGRDVMIKTYDAGINKLDLSSFGPGLYILTVQEGRNITTLKLKLN